MLVSLHHLGLEVESLSGAAAFYVDRLGLVTRRRTESELAVEVGDAELVLRRPSGTPRGGLHTHFAFATPPAEYDDWLERVDDLDPVEFDFGAYRSLYVFDADRHCVEIGGCGEGGDGLTGVFEIVLEVTDLERAEAAYTALGFDPVDRGSKRRRVRLRGPFDLELWEPQLGIADARGGVHVDLGLVVHDADAAVESMGEWVCDRTAVEGGVRAVDRDGHVLTFLDS